MYFIEHLLLVIGLCIATDSETDEETMMISNEEQKMIIINSLENLIKNISLIFNIIYEHIETLEEESRINQEPIKEECKDIISTFKIGTETYSKTMKKLMDDIQDDRSFDLERTDDLFRAKDTYVEIMDKTFYMLDDEYPFEDEIVAKFKEGRKALNQEPDIEEIFADDEKMATVDYELIEPMVEDYAKLHGIMQQFLERAGTASETKITDEGKDNEQEYMNVCSDPQQLCSTMVI